MVDTKLIMCSSVMESINEMMINQDARDRMSYRDVAMEAVLSPAGKSKLLQQLYVDIINKSNIDFGEIPNSRGDVTKYKYYEQVSLSIGTLNQLFDAKQPEEVVLLNKLHDLIITLRGDFEFGYKFSIDIIKLTYNLLVMSLHEMINICIIMYANYLKDVKSIDFKFNNTKSGNYLVLEYTKNFLTSYEKGEWAVLVKEFKGSASNATGNTNSPSGLFGLLYQVVNGVAKPSVGGVGYDVKNIGPASTGGKVVIVILAVIAAFIAIRKLIYFFYNRSAKVQDYVKTQSEFLKHNLETDGTTEGSEKKKKMLDDMEHLVSNIETKILKTESSTKKDLAESDKKNFSAASLKDDEEFSLI